MNNVTLDDLVEITDMLVREYRWFYPIKRELLKLGFSHISSGSFKKVYQYQDCPYVVKLIADWSGALESENYATAPSYLLKYLVPILHENTHFQIQEYVRSEVKCRPSTCPIEHEGIGDVNNGYNHYHTADGRCLIYDYGQPMQWDFLRRGAA